MFSALEIVKTAYNIRILSVTKTIIVKYLVQIKFSSRLGSSKFQYFSESKLVLDLNKKVETRTRPDFGFESGRARTDYWAEFMKPG